MSKRSGTNSIPFWGQFPDSTELPNVSGATKQTTFLEAGDQAYTTSDSTFWICTTATPGAAVWMPSLDKSSTIVFQPGGTEVPGIVVTTYTALQAAVAAFPGPVTVVFDDTLGAIVLPTGAWVVTYAMTWRGIGNFVVPVAVTIDDGFTCAAAAGQCGVSEFNGDVAFSATATTTAPFPITAANATIKLRGSPLTSSAPFDAGVAGFFEIGSGVTLGADIYGVQAGNNMFSFVDGSSALLFSTFDGTVLQTDTWLIGAAGSAQWQAADSSVSVKQDPSGFGGTVSDNETGAKTTLTHKFAGALTPTGSADTYTADATGTSASGTALLRYTYDFKQNLMTLRFFVYVNTLASDMTVKIRRTTSGGVTSDIDTFTVTHGVTGLTSRDLAAFQMNIDDALDIETSGSGAGTARFTAIIRARAYFADIPL